MFFKFQGVLRRQKFRVHQCDRVIVFLNTFSDFADRLSLKSYIKMESISYLLEMVSNCLI